MDTEDLYGGVLLNCKKKKALSSVKTWVDLEGVTPGETNQTKRKIYNFTYMWTLRDRTNEQV